MKTFFMWPAEQDQEFRSAFKAATGVNVQSSPNVSADGNHYMVGHDIKPEHISLIGQTPGVIISDGTPPGEWIGKDEYI